MFIQEYHARSDLILQMLPEKNFGGKLARTGTKYVSVRICYQRNKLTAKVGLFEYQVLNGKLIVPTGCENSSVRYCSVSIPFACAVAAIE